MNDDEYNLHLSRQGAMISDSLSSKIARPDTSDQPHQDIPGDFSGHLTITSPESVIKTQRVTSFSINDSGCTVSFATAKKQMLKTQALYGKNCHVGYGTITAEDLTCSGWDFVTTENQMFVTMTFLRKHAV